MDWIGAFLFVAHACMHAHVHSYTRVHAWFPSAGGGVHMHMPQAEPCLHRRTYISLPRYTYALFSTQGEVVVMAQGGLPHNAVPTWCSLPESALPASHVD